MLLSQIFCAMLLLSIVSALVTGSGSTLSASVPLGAQAGITLAISLAGSLCLWSGAGRLMEKIGITAFLSRLFRPVLHRLFPSTRHDPDLAGDLSGNICANFLGLGNAATPMGISAARRLAAVPGQQPSAELCRLIVLNTASIQLIPTNVAAMRSALGCASPFDILPAVWITSLCSATAGLGMARILGKRWGDA